MIKYTKMQIFRGIVWTIGTLLLSSLLFLFLGMKVFSEVSSSCRVIGYFLTEFQCEHVFLTYLLNALIFPSVIVITISFIIFSTIEESYGLPVLYATLAFITVLPFLAYTFGSTFLFLYKGTIEKTYSLKWRKFSFLALTIVLLPTVVARIYHTYKVPPLFINHDITVNLNPYVLKVPRKYLVEWSVRDNRTSYDYNSESLVYFSDRYPRMLIRIPVKELGYELPDGEGIKVDVRPYTDLNISKQLEETVSFLKKDFTSDNRIQSIQFSKNWTIHLPANLYIYKGPEKNRKNNVVICMGEKTYVVRSPKSGDLRDYQCGSESECQNLTRLCTARVVPDNRFLYSYKFNKADLDNFVDIQERIEAFVNGFLVAKEN